MKAKRNVLVIGGGVIGVACAYYLNRDGHQVTVIDKGEIGAECSKGNCGLVCPSHVLPLAEPGAIGSAAASMLKPGGPFHIRPRIDPAMWKWMASFAKRCNRDDMIESAKAIQPLLTSSLDLYRELVATEGIECEFHKQGLLFVYRNSKALDAYEPTNRLLTERFNEPAQKIEGDELLEFEPALRSGLAGAWYFEHDAHLRPDRLMASWRSLLEQRGVRFVENRALEDFNVSSGHVASATASGEAFDADLFVVATGARTPLLAPILGQRVPIEPGKGYSITVPRPATCPTYPMIFPERRVAVTPMETGLRLGSIMEFTGYDESIRPERLRLLTSATQEYLRDVQFDESWPEKWYGWRPMTYDSTPVIGRCPGLSNVYLATGHNMLGLSMAPATGRLIAEMLSDSDTHISPTPYRVERFSA